MALGTRAAHSNRSDVGWSAPGTGPGELQADAHPQKQSNYGVGASDIAGRVSVDQGKGECRNDGE